MNRLEKIARQALISQKAHDMGIIPIISSDIYKDFCRVLDSLPKEESRKLRRKFRKMWRKLVLGNNTFNSDDLIMQSGKARASGLGIARPNRSHKIARKVLVSKELEKIVLSNFSDDALKKNST